MPAGPDDNEHGRSGTSPRPPQTTVSLNVVRPSTMSRRRAVSLGIVHLLIIGHVAHWVVAGRTLSPVEPSEAMYTLNHGYVNAGFIFFALTLAATLLLGRFVCGWACHVVAYQDICAWLLKKIGLKPKPFRSRILVFAPLALALYMFVWPSAYRWWIGHTQPEWTNHLIKARFWETFPGPAVGVVTLLVCGFVIVYFLGSKGFCTYACPYGGFYALAERVAPGRVRVTDACAGCGHCTAACTSNVRVHEEVARYAMVVDPGCMKCLDCVSVCPNDALYFGVGRPSLGVKPSAPTRAVAYDFHRWEEGVAVVVGLAALLAFRGLYGEIPLLLAAAVAAITAYVFVKALRLAGSANVRMQHAQLKRGGRLTRAGAGFAVFTVALLVFTAHSAAVQYHSWRGHKLQSSLAIGDEVWLADGDWWDRVSAEERSRADSAVAHLEWAKRWGLLDTPRALQELVWLYLAKGRDREAEDTARRLIALRPRSPFPHRGLAGVLRKSGRVEDAEVSYRRALAIDASFRSAREDLAGMLHSIGRDDDAVSLYREAIELSREETRWPVQLARLLMSCRRRDEAIREMDRVLEWAPDCVEAHALRGVAAMQVGDPTVAVEHFRHVIALKPERASGHYDLGMAFLALRQIPAAIEQFQLAVEFDPDMAIAHYNLGVAKYMVGELDAAASHVQNSLRLSPDDPVAEGFLAFLYREGGARESVPRDGIAAPEGSEPDRSTTWPNQTPD